MNTLRGHLTTENPDQVLLINELEHSCEVYFVRQPEPDARIFGSLLVATITDVLEYPYRLNGPSTPGDRYTLLRYLKENLSCVTSVYWPGISADQHRVIEGVIDFASSLIILPEMA